jgi:hypothetical protein
VHTLLAWWAPGLACCKLGTAHNMCIWGLVTACATINLGHASSHLQGALLPTSGEAGQALTMPTSRLVTPPWIQTLAAVRRIPQRTTMFGGSACPQAGDAAAEKDTQLTATLRRGHHDAAHRPVEWAHSGATAVQHAGLAVACQTAARSKACRVACGREHPGLYEQLGGRGALNELHMPCAAIHVQYNTLGCGCCPCLFPQLTSTAPSPWPKQKDAALRWRSCSRTELPASSGCTARRSSSGIMPSWHVM